MSTTRKSRRERVFDEIQARVRDHAECPFKTLFRSRIRVIELDECPSFTMYPVAESVDYEDSQGRVVRDLLWRGALRTMGDDSDLDELHMYLVRRVLGEDGGALGDLAVETKEVGTEWVIEVGTDLILGSDIEFVTQYFTDAVDQESMG